MMQESRSGRNERDRRPRIGPIRTAWRIVTGMDFGLFHHLEGSQRKRLCKSIIEY